MFAFWDVILNLPWIKRQDLLATPHDSGGWVVKDPLTLNYALLDDAEYAILNLLDGRTSFARMLGVLQQRFPDRGVGPDDLAEFIRALAGHQLIRQTVTGDSLRLSNANAAHSGFGLLRPLLQILRLQVPLVNPSRFLTVALPYAGFMFRPAFLKAMLAVAVLALTMVVLRFAELQRALPSMQEFLGPQNVVIMLVMFVSVKLLHEAGHAFTARHFGAECNECGVMLMVLTPVLYTNVSDAWMLPRTQRMLVTASGILVELSVASICTSLWWICEPGVTRTLLLNTMLLCSVNTLLFNGNPLLRFDGYFLLADWLRIPNLSSRAGSLVQAWLLQLITGRPQAAVNAERRKATLLTYGLLAMAYRAVLTLAILRLIQQVTAQWKVEFVGTVLSLSLLTGSIILPILRFSTEVARYLRNDGLERSVTHWRTLASLVLLAGMILIPLPQTIVAPAIIQPTSDSIYSQLSGRIQPVARYGQTVKAGDVLAVQENPGLQKQQQRLVGRKQELQAQLNALLSNPATSNSELIPTLRNSLAAATQSLSEFDDELSRLTVISHADGIFFPPPERSRQTRVDLPAHWSGLPVDAHNEGAWIDRGTLLGYVGSTNDQKIIAYVDEADIEYVRKGNAAEFAALAGSQTIDAEVDGVGHLKADSLPTSLGVAGLSTGRPAAEGITPGVTTFPLTARFKQSAGVTQKLYTVGRVRIRTSPASIGARFIRYLRQTF